MKNAELGIFSLNSIAETTIAKFFNEEKCRQWILSKLHPGGAICPKCKFEIKSETSIKRFWSGERLSCVRCGSYYTALTGTFCSGTNLSYCEIYCLGLLVALNKDARTISNYMGISKKTVRLWKAKFEAVEAMKICSELSPIKF
jgi:hypothetical protein